MCDDQPKLNPVTLAKYIEEMGLRDKFEKWDEAHKPEAVKSNSTDLLSAEDKIRQKLNEAADIAHKHFMELPKHHTDEGWWRDLSAEIHEMVNDYL